MDFWGMNFWNMVAIALAAISLWLGWRSDNRTKNFLEELRNAHRRESDRVDKMLEHLIKTSQGNSK